ncbi:MAG TPA: DUF11 domain-containing protein [bacterium]|nr:DUF11 domain-containing protein [bacterium]
MIRERSLKIGELQGAVEPSRTDPGLDVPPFGRLRPSWGLAFLIFLWALLPSPVLAWVNGDFETCNLTGWTTSTNSGANLACGPPTASSVPVGWAPLSNNMLPMVHGGNCAAQLYSARGDENHQDWARIQQTDVVPSDGRTCLSFWFAAVFEDHHYEVGQSEDTYIQADVIVGGTTIASLVYNWANNLAIVVFDGLTGTGGAICAVNPTTENRWGYLPWTNYTINLCQYVGQQVTLRFTDYDCGQGGHYGWGYVDDVTWAACPQPPTMSLTKSNDPSGPVTQGQVITYTLTYGNSGPGLASGVTVTDPIPPGTSFVPGSQTSSPSMPNTFVSGGQVGWSIGNLPAGASGTLSFQVRASQSCVTIINQASLSDLEQACY